MPLETGKLKPFVKRAIAGAVVGLLLLAVLLLAKPMAPMKRGTSADFWNHACALNARQYRGGGVYTPREGRYVYYDQHLNGQSIFWVPAAEAAADFPSVVRQVQQAADSTNALPLLQWSIATLREDPSAAHDPDKFLMLVRERMLKAMKDYSETLYQYRLDQDAGFSERWRQMRRYWINILFEMLFFIGLSLFAFWPWLRNRSLMRQTLHLALVPFLLFTPFYLGYCGWSFTSAGPTGGALYPWLIVQFRSASWWTPLDEWLVRHVPQVLGSISQSPGSMMSVRGGAPFGPLAALLAGVGILLAGWGIAMLKRRGVTISKLMTRSIWRR
jgi:hypothetical protein